MKKKNFDKRWTRARLLEQRGRKHHARCKQVVAISTSDAVRSSPSLMLALVLVLLLTHPCCVLPRATAGGGFGSNVAPTSTGSDPCMERIRAHNCARNSLVRLAIMKYMLGHLSARATVFFSRSKFACGNSFATLLAPSRGRRDSVI